MATSNLVTAALTTLILATPALAKRPLSIDDLTQMRDVAAPSVDPSGTWVAYSVESIDTAKDDNVSHLWMTSWDGRRTVQLTSRAGESESTPRWSPDGRFLGFISSRGDKEENDQLWVLNRTGGEARRIGKIAGSVVDFVWSPDGRSIAALVLDPDPDKMDAVRPDRPGAPQPPTVQADAGERSPTSAGKNDDDTPPKPIVIDRFQFKRDIDGYLGKRRQRLFLIDVASGAARRLTTGDDDEYLPAFSPDGRRIAFVSNRDPDPDRSYNYDLWTVAADAQGAAPTQLTTFAGDDNNPDYESYPAWSPDGRSLAYIQGGPVELFAYGTHRLAVVAAAGGAPRIITAGLDRNITNPLWSADGRSLHFIVEDDQSLWLGSASAAGGKVRHVAGGDQVFSTIDGRKRIAALVMDQAHPPEVYAVEGSRLRQLSHHNDWLAEVDLAPVERTRLKSRDGTEVHGFLLRPPGAPAGPLPTVLRIHGGPQWQFDMGFEFEWQLLAANGFAVVAANPRGSTGRGQDFGKAIYAAWGSVDVPDVLAAVDDAVARGIADPNRLGVGGWSYGGILTNYVIASDPRFKAATSGASISNILAGYGTDQYIRDYEMELGKPWEKPQLWLDLSYPFLHAERIVTPTLFLCGDKDFNVPLLNSEQMYQALRSRGIDTKLIIYPGEFHGIERPSFVRDRLQRYLDWYAAHLK